MKPKEVRKNLEDIGIVFEAEDSSYPRDSEVTKVISIENLMVGFTRWLINDGDLLESSGQVADEWIREAAEEWLFG